MLAFAAKRGEIDPTNLGCNRFTPLLVDLREWLEQSPYFAGYLSEWVRVNPSTKLPDLEEDEAVSFIPMEVVSERTGEVGKQEAAFSQVATGYTRFAEGDILWAKITPCMQNGKSGITQGLIRKVGFGSTKFHILRPNMKEVTPEYLWSLLSLDRVTTAAQAVFTGTVGQQRVPDTFLKTLPFPKPSLSKQNKIASEFDITRVERDEATAKADSLLSGIDPWLTKQLGIKTPKNRVANAYVIHLKAGEPTKQLGVDFHEEPVRDVFAIRATRLNKRFNPHFYSTAFVHAVSSLKQVANKPLGEIATFSNETWNPGVAIWNGKKYFRYLEISALGINQNEYSLETISVDEAPSRARMILRANDIVISTIRPHRGAIAIIREEDDGAIGSTGFAVLRNVEEVGYLRDLLIEALLTKVVLLQFQKRSSGGAYLAITLPELKQVLIPFPLQEGKDRKCILEEI